MSHLALRRVMIRMLHDPAFAAAVQREPDAALAGVDLAARERAWLAATPPAAWRTDPARPGRVLAALVEEYPATCALAPERGPAFFGSDAFHAAIQERGSLALAFGDHLAASGDPLAASSDPLAASSDPLGASGDPLAARGDLRIGVLARLEQAIAAVRRADAPAPGTAGDALRLAPRARVLRVPGGALALLAAVRAGAPPGPLGAADEPVLIFAPKDGGEVTVEALAPALAALLERAVSGARRAELLAEARRQGADSGEDVQILADLESDGLLVGAGPLPV